MSHSAPTQMCPMSEMCKGMTESPPSRLFLVVPGIIFIVLGVLVILQPTILLWLVAAVLVMVGVGMLFGARMMGKFGEKPRSGQE